MPRGGAREGAGRKPEADKKTVVEAFTQEQIDSSLKRIASVSASSDFNDDLIKGVWMKVVEAALNGNIQAAKIILDKAIPNLKPSDQPFKISRLPKEPLEQIAYIKRQVSTGKITAEQARSLVELIKAELENGKIIELAQSLEELKEQLEL
jgi:hypothetical protein